MHLANIGFSCIFCSFILEIKFSRLLMAINYRYPQLLALFSLFLSFSGSPGVLYPAQLAIMAFFYFYLMRGQNGIVFLLSLHIGISISPKLFFPLGTLLLGHLSSQFLEAVRFALSKHTAGGHSSAQIYSFILEHWTLSGRDSLHSDCFL